MILTSDPKKTFSPLLLETLSLKVSQYRHTAAPLTLFPQTRKLLETVIGLMRLPFQDSTETHAAPNQGFLSAQFKLHPVVQKA